MKKQSMYVFLASALLLAGCSGKEAAPSAVSAGSLSEPPAYYEGYAESPQVTGDQTLLAEGETVRDDKGELKLEAVNLEGETQNIGEIELTVQEAKNLRYTPSYGLIDFFHSYTHETEFNVVKLFVEITNTGDEPLRFGPVALLETSAGETKLWEDDVYLEELNGEIAPGETKKGNLGFLIEKPDVESIVITTSDLFNENGETIVPAQQFNIDF
jgi:hypothetical protein